MVCAGDSHAIVMVNRRHSVVTARLGGNGKVNVWRWSAVIEPAPTSSALLGSRL